MKNRKNDPDGPLPKWGEPEGVKQYMKKTPQTKTIKVGEDTVGAPQAHYALVKKREVVAVGTKEEMLQLHQEEGGRVWVSTKNIGDIVEAKYSVDVEGLPRFYMDADSPAQIKKSLRVLLRKASSIDSVERVNDAKIKQDLRQRIKGGETDSRIVDEEAMIDEASLRMKVAARGKIETKLRKMKNDDADMVAFLINQDDQKELAKFMKSLNPKSRKAIEAIMKEGTDFAAHRAAQAQAPTQADREKMRKVAQLLAKERKMKKEEVEQIDELKKSTLKSYLQKTANKPSTGKWDKTDKGRMGANRRVDGKFYHKGSKHDPKTGEVIPSKYKAEEVDLEEGVEYHAHGKVFKKKGEAIAHHAKKRGNKSDSYAVHRVDTKTNTITHGFDSQGRSKQLGFNKDKYDRLKAGKSIGEGVDEAKDYNAEIQRHKDIASKQRKKMSKATSHADMVSAMNRHMKAKKNQKSLTRAQAHMEEIKLDEKLKPSMGAGEYVKDFQDSDAPQFKGKSKEKRQKMAIAAYLAAKRGDK